MGPESIHLLQILDLLINLLWNRREFDQIKHYIQQAITIKRAFHQQSSYSLFQNYCQLGILYLNCSAPDVEQFFRNLESAAELSSSPVPLDQYIRCHICLLYEHMQLRHDQETAYELELIKELKKENYKSQELDSKMDLDFAIFHLLYGYNCLHLGNVHEAQ